MLIVAFQMEQHQSLSPSLAGIRTILAGSAACSMPARMPALGAAPDQRQEMDCDALNGERTRLLARREDLNKPLLSSNTDAKREAELTK